MPNSIETCQAIPNPELVSDFIETRNFDSTFGTNKSIFTSHTFRRAVKAAVEGIDPAVIDESHNTALEIIKGNTTS